MFVLLYSCFIIIVVLFFKLINSLFFIYLVLSHQDKQQGSYHAVSMPS